MLYTIIFLLTKGWYIGEACSCTPFLRDSRYCLAKNLFILFTFGLFMYRSIWWEDMLNIHQYKSEVWNSTWLLFHYQGDRNITYIFQLLKKWQQNSTKIQWTNQDNIFRASKNGDLEQWNQSKRLTFIHSQADNSFLHITIWLVMGRMCTIKYMSEQWNAALWTWRKATRDTNSASMPVSSFTSRTAAAPKSSSVGEWMAHGWNTS